MIFNERQLARLNRMLLQLPKKIRNKVLRVELRRAAKELVKPNKDATPVRTGLLRKSVKVRSIRSRTDIGFTTGYSEKNFVGKTFYGAFLEFGWKAGKRPSRTQKDNRIKIPARRMLGKVAEAKGPSLLVSARTRIMLRIAEEARNG
jgi:hypothetical protein